MLRYIEGLKLQEESNGETKKGRSKSKMKKEDEEPNVHDGLTVDYAKFTELTKNMLQNAHVVR